MHDPPQHLHRRYRLKAHRGAEQKRDGYGGLHPPPAPVLHRAFLLRERRVSGELQVLIENLPKFSEKVFDTVSKI
nr:MAG TPA: hypothetical protein [Caudoviricetes sp.]